MELTPLIVIGDRGLNEEHFGTIIYSLLIHNGILPMEQSLEDQVLAVLAASPEGVTARALRAALARSVSQPTLWRLLDELRAKGLVAVEGKARATRYHATHDNRIAEIRSRRLHELAARTLIRHPERLERVRGRLRQLQAVNPHGARYHRQWQALIDGPTPELLRAMTEDSDSAAALRRESPFTVLVDKRDRARLFERLRAG